MNKPEEMEYIICWSRDEFVNLEEIKDNDGFCPHCNQEIDLNDH